VHDHSRSHVGGHHHHHPAVMPTTSAPSSSGPVRSGSKAVPRLRTLPAGRCLTCVDTGAAIRPCTDVLLLSGARPLERA
jgi:hypothetical protein